MLGRVTVVGCGLIGGSIIKRLRARSAVARLAAVDRNEVLELARAYLDVSAPAGSSGAADLIAESDLVVLAMPVGAIVRDMRGVLDAVAPDAVVTDTGSIKMPMLDVAVRHAKGSQFVGGHPMAGREVGGFDASQPNLFEGTRWFIVENASQPSLPAAEHDAADGIGASAILASSAVTRVAELARAVGAEPTVIDPEEHDRVMAYVSHVPQLLASALYGAAARGGALDQAGQGFRDMTRIAGGPSAMWRDILDGNRERIATALREVLEPLIELRDTLGQEKDSGLSAAVDLLERAASAKTRLRVSS